LRRKFYDQPEDEKRFLQDRSRLLAWVVLWPASWLNSRGVTIPADSYRAIFFKTMLQADSYRDSRIKYRPAWLRQVIQSHFKIHGEDYYNEAKSTRNLIEQTMLLVGKPNPVSSAADPVREMANARAILTSMAPKKVAKAPSKPAVKDQLSLF